MSFELKCYDVITDKLGVVGVALPYPEPEHGGWCWFYRESSWNPLVMRDGVLYDGSGSNNPIKTVHRATSGARMRAIACYVAYKDRNRCSMPSLDSLQLVYSNKPIKLGEYDAMFCGSGEETTLQVGCQKIPYDQLVEAFKQFESLTKEDRD